MNPGALTIVFVSLTHCGSRESCVDNVKAFVTLVHVSFGGAHLE